MAKAVKPSTTKATAEKSAPAKKVAKTAVAEKAPVVTKETPKIKELAVETAVVGKPESKAAESKGAKSEPSGTATSKTPSFEVIAHRAFVLFEQRGYAHGFDKEDWLEAERQLIESLN